MINLIGGIAGQIIGIFGKWGDDKQANITARLSQMERSYTDEVIIAYWFGPTLVALFGWIEPLARQQEMVTGSDQIFTVQLALTAAVFGLGKLNGRTK